MNSNKKLKRHVSTDTPKIEKSTDLVYLREKKYKVSEEEYKEEMKSPFVKPLEESLSRFLPIGAFTVAESDFNESVSITMVIFYEDKDDSIFNNIGRHIGARAMSYTIKEVVSASDIDCSQGTIVDRVATAFKAIHEERVHPMVLYKVNGTRAMLKKMADEWIFITCNNGDCPKVIRVLDIKTIEGI